MSWRDNLREASFRGIPFKVRTSGRGVGRRNVNHQFPFNDIPYNEDTGLDADDFNLTGYIIQNTENDFDYFEERDALIDALRAEGSGILVHPFYGEFTVSVNGKARISESFDNGGMATFNMVFVLAGEPRTPTPVPDDKGLLDSAVEAAREALDAAFNAAYDATGAGYLFGEQGALADAQQAMNMVSSTLHTVQARSVAAITSALTSVATFKGSLSSIMQSPSDLVDALSNTFAIYSGLIPELNTKDNSTPTRTATGTSTPTGLGTAPSLTGEPLKSKMLVEAALAVTEYGEPMDEPNAHGGTLTPIPDTTDTREQQKTNRDAMIDLVRGLALLEAMNVAINADYGSREEAQDTLDRVMRAFDNVLDEIGDNSKNDEVFQTLLEVKPFFVNAMERKGASLPATSTVEVPAEPYPTLTIAYDLYGDLGRENEIIARNPVDIIHPGFPAGGVELEVSSE